MSNILIKDIKNGNMLHCIIKLLEILRVLSKLNDKTLSEKPLYHK